MTAELKDCYVRPRRSVFLPILISIAFVGASFTAPASALDSPPTDESWQAAAEAASATPAELKAEVSDGSLDLVVVRDVDGTPVASTVRIQSTSELEKVLAALSKEEPVVAVEPEVKFRLSDNSFPATFSPRTAAASVNLNTIETTSNGSGIKVAVIDSGVDARHVDLSGQVLDGVDYRDGISYVDFYTENVTGCISYTNNPDPQKPVHADFGKYDPNGHGTHVAGIIAAKGFGPAGVATGAKILPIRVLDTFGSGDSSDVACGITWAADNGANIINMSLGSETESIAVTAAIKYALDLGVVVIAAAGNSGPINTRPSYPAATKTGSAPDRYDVIAVGATDATGHIQGFSSRGSYVDVSAPGAAILSTCMAAQNSQTVSGVTSRTACTSSDGSERYELLSGTSMATPHVAGLAALIMSANPGMTYQDVTETLISLAIDKGSPGFDTAYGFGFVKAPTATSRNQAGTLSASNSAALAEESRLEAIQSAAAAEVARIAAEKAAADKLAADKLAADQAAAAEAVRVAASLPVVKKSLTVKALKKKRISISVAAPTGSKTFVQRKVGKKWKNVLTTTTVPSLIAKVSKAGSYRVRIEIPTGTITTKTYKVK